MIIVLNGAPSSGKSVLAREIMHQSDRPFLYFSIDHLVNFWIDEKFIAFEDEPKAWFFNQHLDKEQAEHLSVHGPNPQQLHWDLLESLIGLVQKGYDLIIDEILWNSDIFEHLAKLLVHTDKVYLVKVICDLIECERREKQRKDRYQGLARTLYEQTYQGLNYDLEVDTTRLAKTQAATLVLDFIAKNANPSAFTDYLKSNIEFMPLQVSHLALIHRWINQGHLQTTWGEGKHHPFEEIESKYQTYLQRYKIHEGAKKPIYGFIITCGGQPIGYIQYYDAYDFPRTPGIVNLPEGLAALDVYIGEPAYLSKGIGAQAVRQFLQQHVFVNFDVCLVDPNVDNVYAIKAYERAGFKTIKEFKSERVLWMVAVNVLRRNAP